MNIVEACIDRKWHQTEGFVLAIATSLLPRSPGLNFYRGVYLYYKGMFNKGLEALDTSLREDPDAANTYFWKGNIWLAKDELLNARDEFRRAYEKEQRASSCLGLAEVYDKLEEPGLARHYYEEAIEIEPRGETYLLYAAFLLFHDDLDEADKWLERGIALFPHEYSLHLIRGNLRKEQGKLEEAIKNFEAAEELDATNIHALNALCKAHFEANNTEEALKYYKQISLLKTEQAREYSKKLNEQYSEIIAKLENKRPPP